MNQERENKKELAFQYSKLNFRQTEIAKEFSVSQSTISNWLKDMRYREQIAQLNQKLQEEIQYGRSGAFVCDVTSHIVITTLVQYRSTP